MDTFSIHLLFLPVQRTAHDKFWGHDMGNRLGSSKAAGDNTLLFRRLYNGSLSVVFVAGSASLGVVDVLADNHLCRDDFQSAENFLANLGHSVTALRAH